MCFLQTCTTSSDPESGSTGESRATNRASGMVYKYIRPHAQQNRTLCETLFLLPTLKIAHGALGEDSVEQILSIYLFRCKLWPRTRVWNLGRFSRPISFEAR